MLLSSFPVIEIMSFRCWNSWKAVPWSSHTSNFTFTCEEICKTSRHLLYLIPWVIFFNKSRNVIACLPKPSQFDVHLCKKLCDWHVTWAYACDWSEQLKVEPTGCCVHGKILLWLLTPSCLRSCLDGALARPVPPHELKWPQNDA